MWWLHQQIPDTEEGRLRWEQTVAMIEASPAGRRTTGDEPVPAALPAGTPVTAAEQAAAFDAFAAMG